MLSPQVRHIKYTIHDRIRFRLTTMPGLEEVSNVSLIVVCICPSPHSSKAHMNAQTVCAAKFWRNWNHSLEVARIYSDSDSICDRIANNGNRFLLRFDTFCHVQKIKWLSTVRTVGHMKEWQMIFSKHLLPTSVHLPSSLTLYDESGDAQDRRFIMRTAFIEIGFDHLYAVTPVREQNI